MWVSFSERPLRVEELCHALGVEIESTDLDPENIPAIRTVVSSCLGLLKVGGSSSMVRLVHFTLQEDLSSDPILFNSPHSTIAEVCLTYLNYRSVRDLSPTLDMAPSTMPFLEYASDYWGEHTRKGMTNNVKRLVRKLLDRFDEHISAQLLLLRYTRSHLWGLRFDGLGGPVGFTGLHGVAYLGIVEIIAAVFEMKEWDINASDCTGSTPLTWAAYNGHEEVVKMLLEREEVNLNHADSICGWTPLRLAVLGASGGCQYTFGAKRCKSQPGRHLSCPDATLLGGYDGAEGGGKDAFGAKGGQPRPARHQRWPDATVFGGWGWA